MLHVFFVLIFTKNAFSTVHKSLSCYTTNNFVVDTFPKFTLDGSRTENISYASDDIGGTPVCVMFFGYNKTHSSAWQGHVSGYALPLDCLIDSDRSTYCFHSPNAFFFLKLKTGFACCCSWDNCNLHNPWFFQMYEQKMLNESLHLDKILSICKYSFCISLMVSIVFIETILEMCIRRWGGLSKKKKYEDPKKVESRTFIESRSPGDVLKSPMLPSLSLQATQIPSSQNISEISVMKPSEEIAQLERTQEDDASSHAKRTELEQEDTQSDNSGRLPIPPRPELKMLPSGRMQRTSMNYEESTYSDLQ